MVFIFSDGGAAGPPIRLEERKSQPIIAFFLLDWCFGLLTIKTKANSRKIA